MATSISGCTNFIRNVATALLRQPRQLSCIVIPRGEFHNTSLCLADFDPEQKSRNDKLNGPKHFLTYNDVVYPPTAEGEPARPAEVCHMRANIMCSAKKMWYASVLVRGLSIDEALKQCSFNKKLGPHIIREVLLEAQEIAVRDHNVEYKSNLWVADSFVTKGMVVKGMRRHARGRIGVIHHRYSHYFVRLREGTPPEHYYAPHPTGYQQLEEYITEQRKRRIINSL